MDEKKYVSRAGLKLEHAINHFQIEVKEKVCADFGCSTGGFTDCLLKYGAKKVYAIDTAYGELDWNLRNNPQVEVMERTNALYIELPEKVDLITIDTGWTKQEKIIPSAIKNLKEGGEIISLIKPHYEAPKDILKGGILNEEDSETILNETVDNIKEKFNELEIIGYVKSPIQGKKGGNVEYLAYMRLR